MESSVVSIEDYIHTFNRWFLKCVQYYTRQNIWKFPKCCCVPSSRHLYQGYSFNDPGHFVLGMCKTNLASFLISSFNLLLTALCKVPSGRESDNGFFIVHRKRFPSDQLLLLLKLLQAVQKVHHRLRSLQFFHPYCTGFLMLENIISSSWFVPRRNEFCYCLHFFS